MKCKNCGNILPDNAITCFLCGSADLERVSTEPQTINNNTLNNNYNNINTMNNIYNSNNYENKKRSNKGKLFIAICLSLSFIFFTLSVILGFKDINYYLSSSNQFKTYMESKGYEVSDLTVNNNYKGIETSYIAKKAEYSIIYLYSSDQKSLDNSYNNVKKSIINAETDDIKDKININQENYKKYMVNDNNRYKVVIEKDNSVVFSNANIKYKDNIDKELSKLGYDNSKINIYFVIFMLLGILTLCILYLVSLWKIFEKTGRKGYISLIPFYNLYLLVNITIGSGWLFLLMFIPIVNILFYIYLSLSLAKIFGKNAMYALEIIFLGFIFIPLLAFDNSVYLGIKKN